MKIKSVLENLKTKKITVYIRNLGQYSQFRGILKEITDEIIILFARYNKIIYIPISEIVVVTEDEGKSRGLEVKFTENTKISTDVPK